MEMNLQTTKLELIQWLSTIDNPSIIEKILAIRNNEKEDWWEFDIKLSHWFLDRCVVI